MADIRAADVQPDPQVIDEFIHVQNLAGADVLAALEKAGAPFAAALSEPVEEVDTDATRRMTEMRRDHMFQADTFAGFIAALGRHGGGDATVSRRRRAARSVTGAVACALRDGLTPAQVIGAVRVGLTQPWPGQHGEEV